MQILVRLHCPTGCGTTYRSAYAIHFHGTPGNYTCYVGMPSNRSCELYNSQHACQMLINWTSQRVGNQLTVTGRPHAGSSNDPGPDGIAQGDSSPSGPCSQEPSNVGPCFVPHRPAVVASNPHELILPRSVLGHMSDNTHQSEYQRRFANAM